MRVAVLSLIETSHPAQAAGVPATMPAGLRGYLPIGGRSLLRHQIGLALSLGAKRIVVMAEGISGELVALQHVVEAGGARFHVVATARALVPLLAPEDDVIVVGDGLIAMPDVFRDLIEAGPCVLTLPAENALPLGFERIDINHAFAGAMRLPGTDRGWPCRFAARMERAIGAAAPCRSGPLAIARRVCGHAG